MPSLAAYPSMMQRDRKREGLRVRRAAWLVGATVRECREVEDGDDTMVTADVGCTGTTVDLQADVRLPRSTRA